MAGGDPGFRTFFVPVSAECVRLCDPRHQEVALTIALCDELLGGRGAVRVHGGGFAGTVQAYVPLDMLDAFRERTEAVLGSGRCYVMQIRSIGGTLII